MKTGANTVDELSMAARHSEGQTCFLKFKNLRDKNSVRKPLGDLCRDDDEGVFLTAVVSCDDGGVISAGEDVHVVEVG